MIVEERIYTAHPGKLNSFLSVYEKLGLPLQRKYLENLVGYFTSEIGTLNLAVHLWRYEDLEDRRARRARMAADPAFAVYMAEAMPLLQAMENRILLPTAFSPMK